jgi:GNAT superfamily N-acetyltransferase
MPRDLALDPVLLSRLEMQRMANVRRALAFEHEAIGGLVAAWTGPGSWNSEADGWSPDTPTTREHLAGVVSFYAERGSPARVTIAPHVDERLLPDLASLGFRLVDLDQQYVIDLHNADPPPAHYPEGFSVRILDPSDDAAVETWSGLVAGLHFGREVTPDEAELDRRVVRHPNSTCLVLEHHHAPVAIAGLEVYGWLACLFLGATVPAWRRRGLQRAMIHHRLRLARDAGARYAIVGSPVGGPTERNALRAGMSLVFTKLTLERPLEGA